MFNQELRIAEVAGFYYVWGQIITAENAVPIAIGRRRGPQSHEVHRDAVLCDFFANSAVKKLMGIFLIAEGG